MKKFLAFILVLFLFSLTLFALLKSSHQEKPVLAQIYQEGDFVDKFEKGIGFSFESICQNEFYYVTPLGRSYPILTQEDVDYLRELNPDFVLLVTGPAGWHNITQENPYQNGHHPTEWNNPYYDFEPLDKTIRLLIDSGIEPILQIWGTPIWANGIDYQRLGRGCFDFMDYGPVPPSNLEEFGFFMKAVAERYSGHHGFPKINHFALWNEPNIQTFWTGTVEQFVQMNNFAYDKIKEVHPDAEIWGGNTAPCCRGPNPIDWLTQAHGFGFKFDKFGHHPYPHEWTTPPWNQPEKEKDRVPPNYLHRLVEHLDSLSGHEGKHVVVTESGYRLEVGITLEQQAEWLEWSMREANKNPRVDCWTNFLLHDYPDWGTGFLDGITGYQSKGVWATSQYNDVLSKEKAVDFDENTYWSSQIFFGPDVDNEWLSVDLGKQTEINQIVVCPHVVSGQIFSFPKDFGFGYSDDASNWDVIEFYYDYQPIINDDGSFCQVFNFPKTKHRYFSIGATKLSVNAIGNYVFAIAEFRLRKVDETSEYPAYFTFRDFSSCQNNDGICRPNCIHETDSDCHLRGDLDNDEDIDAQDLKILLQNWGASPSIPAADLNSDGVVNGMDFGIMVKLIP